LRLKIRPSPVSGAVAAPPSKSYSHRALILGSLAQGETVIDNFLESDDTRYTLNACRSLGVNIRGNGKTLRITGSGGRLSVQPGQETILVGNSGSTIRMMAPLAALARGKVVFDGTAIRQRPVADLISALNSLRVKASSVERDGYPPIQVQGGRLIGGEVETCGLISSQHISSLLMVAPYTEQGLTVKVTDGLQSKPYLDITIDAMHEFGVEVENYQYKQFTVAGGQGYRGRHYEIEGDYSQAAYFFALAAIGQGPITVSQLRDNSAQGDRHFLDLLSRMGCYVNYDEGLVTVTRDRALSGMAVDMGDYPDITLPLAVVAAFAGGKTEIANIGHLRYKESDRIGYTAAELHKMGVKVEISETTMSVYGGRPKGAVVEGHDDHRLVMSLATAALFAKGDTVINGTEAVTKSYPEFFTHLARLGARVEEI